MPSAQDHDRQTVEIEDDGRLVASATIQGTDDPGTVHTDLHAESGAHLVDAVLAHPDVSTADHLVATMPLGDTEMLERVRERCDDVEAHSAGATKIVDARPATPAGAATEGDG
jgi:hypothetical protein